MTIILAATMLIAVATLAYAVYKGGQCDTLAMENARLLTSAQSWRTAYENVAAENRAITCLGRGNGKDS
mgnify:CR=1 FL=1|jgi:hypothetical protein|nr:MAG TPA: hypothetical protein [Caudoviricetes sp.]